MLTDVHEPHRPSDLYLVRLMNMTDPDLRNINRHGI